MITSKTLLTLVYFLPALLAASFIAWNFNSPIVEGILALGILALTICIFTGALLTIKTTDESVKTSVEILALFTGILLAADILCGILLLGQTGGNQLANLARILFWPTVIYTILIAAPVMNSLMKKNAANGNLQGMHPLSLLSGESSFLYSTASVRFLANQTT